jgi:hypothetical protein
MVTTITTTTMTILTTGAATSLALIGILTLLALLIQKEIVSGLSSVRARRLSRALDVAIVPLIVVFVTAAALKLAELLH